ncbi:hypothetical protein M0802_010078 [Mischocyttarus mexicanus]|nr:hypothetical protein M0802_010078 [Mischocyttarus mexicanus]
MKNILRFVSFPRVILDLIILSIKISMSMIVASFKVVLPATTKSLIGETVLITGAGRGIGRELAIQLGLMGCIVICWDVDIDANRSTMSVVSKNGGEVYGFVVDVSERLEVHEALRTMIKVGIPQVTILINNTAILYHRSFLNHSSDDIQRTFNVNVFSHFWTIEGILPSMLERGKGHIVGICSMCGIYGVSQKVPYCASKFAVRGLMEALHEEIRQEPTKPDIHFTTIYPFYVDTGLAKDPKFPYIFGVVKPDYAASEIIQAIRKNYTEYSIPRCLLSLNAINRIIPESAMRMILDFLANFNRRNRN